MGSIRPQKQRRFLGRNRLCFWGTSRYREPYTYFTLYILHILYIYNVNKTLETVFFATSIVIFMIREKKLKIFVQILAQIKKTSYLCTRNQETRALGRLAQLVQSVCLTSRGSGVRIPQRPQNEETYVVVTYLQVDCVSS